METKQVVAVILKESRREHDFTQEKLAKLINISSRHYIDLEHGRVEPFFSLMIRVRKVCGIDLNAIADFINQSK